MRNRLTDTVGALVALWSCSVTRDLCIHSIHVYSVTAMDGLKISSWLSLELSPTPSVGRAGWAS